MKKVTLTFSETDLGFLATALASRIYDYQFGQVSVSAATADIISKQLQVLLDRIDFEREKLANHENREN